MLTNTPFIVGGVSLFLAFAVVQSISAPLIIRRIYLRYALYLSFILFYFVIRASAILPIAKHLEAILFAGAVISYLLFVKALFHERESFEFLNDITKLGIFAAIICLAVEKSAHFLTDGLPEPWKYIKIMDALLRGPLALMGIFVAALIYIKYPTDHSFSGVFLLGNLFVLLGGFIVAIIVVMSESLPDPESKTATWSYHWRGFVMEAALLLEILCFSLAITRRQALLQMPATVVERERVSVAAQQRPLPEYAQAAVEETPAPGAGTSQRIAFRTSKGFELMKKSEIVLLQGGGNGANFIKVFKDGQKSPVIVSQTLAHAFRMLAEGDVIFQQVHKSYIINSRKVCRLYKDEDGVMTAVMDNDIEVPISANRVQDLKTLLGVE